jgi:hypothetical protein
MGQQQLLLIVLGVIVVGIAVVVGINLFNANAESATQDSLVSQGTSLGAIAQQQWAVVEMHFQHLMVVMVLVYIGLMPFRQILKLHLMLFGQILLLQIVQ